MVLNTFILLCNHHQPSSSRTLSSCKTKTLCNHYTVILHSPFLPSPWKSLFYVLSLWFFSTWSTSYEWNHTVFILLLLAYFIQHNVLKVDPCHSTFLSPWRLTYMKLISVIFLFTLHTLCSFFCPSLSAWLSSFVFSWLFL